MSTNDIIKRIESVTLLVDAFNDLEITYVEDNFYLMLNISEDEFKRKFNNKFLNIINIRLREEFLNFVLSTDKTSVFDLDIQPFMLDKLSLSVVVNSLRTLEDDNNISSNSAIKNINKNIYELTIFSKDLDFNRFEKLKLESELYYKFFELRNICVYIVEKDTYKILYFNDLLKMLIPSIEIGDICYKVKGLNKPCSNCYLKSTYSYSPDFLSPGDKDWIITTNEIYWKDNKKAYVIYGKNSTYNINEFTTYDFLTNAPTITNFKTKFDNINFIYEINKNNKNYVLLSLDIEKFKYINNIWGTMVGDKLLKKVSDVVSDFINFDETFCRVNDDKFLILLHYNTEDNLIQKLNNLFINFEIMKDKYFTYMSIKISCGVCRVDNLNTFDTLLDMCNIAKLSVKGNINISYKIYDKDLQNKFLKHALIYERLETAINNQEFIPYLQPKFNLMTTELCGAEALVRWNSYDGMIYPDEFIPIFEKNGFITTLDFIIYEQVFKFMQQCIQDKIKLVPISLNASKEHVLDKDIDFIESLFKLIDRYQIPLKLIEIEITENAFMGEKAQLKTFVDDLRETGIKVSIDDFGSAYSSLNSLKDIDVDIIKLDRAFLTSLESVKITELLNKDNVIVANIVKLTKDLNLSVVCEGIETEEQLEFLRDIGCTCGQGYLFSKAIPIEEFKDKFLLYK